MAPLIDIEALRIRSTDIYSSLFRRERSDPSFLDNRLLTTRDAAPLSPFLDTRDPAPPIRVSEPGQGSFDPRNINNRGIFALFALLGASLVLASIWFFFWAKNGGFHWRKGDWEEYKSTVLRRKGRNGKTLSGATRSTELGGGSIVAEIDRDLAESLVEEEGGGGGGVRGGTTMPKKKKIRIPRGKKNNADADVRAYRHEKPARVGGINRAADGSYHTGFADSTDPSTYSARPSSPSLPSVVSTSSRFTRNRRRSPAPAAAPTTPTKKHLLHHFRRNNKNNTPSSTTPPSISHRPLRQPSPSAPSTDTTPTRSSHRPSPRKTNPRRAPSTNVSASYTEPLDFESRYTTVSSEAYEIEDLESRGTKSYFHPIPALTGRRDGTGEGSFGGRNSGFGGGGGGRRDGEGGGGFRRGGGRGSRRDSLSDSEGEGTMMS